MSRQPPRIEQVIDGVPVPGWRVQPISRDDILYALSSVNRENEVGNICAQDCFVTATDAKGAVLWKTRYATFAFNTMLETDVQEHFPVDFAFHENGIELVIKHEYYSKNNRVYRVMLADGGEKPKSFS